MGDVVYVELPKVGESFKRGDVFGVVESVKAASDCYLPVSGAIAEINTALGDAPQKVNEDPYGEGWFVKVKIADPSELEVLMSAADYVGLLKEEEEKE
jgi:glycine cleavage system H protein